MPVVGPHVGAVLGASLYQLFIGLHWSVEEEPTKDEKVFKSQEPTTDEVFKNHSSYNGHGLSSKFKHAFKSLCLPLIYICASIFTCQNN